MPPSPRPTSNGPVGILLAQLGTPDAPTPRAVRRYLAEFLWDRRVVDRRRLPWWLVLHGIILRIRPRRSAGLYRRVWTEEGSPLLVNTRLQAEGLAERLRGRHGAGVTVAFGMRYGNPSLASALDGLLEAGCGRLLVFPLYPQYSVATTASVLDAVLPRALDRIAVPALRIVPPFPTHPAYVAALARRVRETVGDGDLPPLLVSFHGEPVRYRELGDPYEEHCRATADALATELGVAREDMSCVFQSRFGPDPWLRPYLDETLVEMGCRGARSVIVVMPGFVADCLETLDEVGREGRQSFVAAGGGVLQVVPCLNDHVAWLDALALIAEEQLQGWI